MHERQDKHDTEKQGAVTALSLEFFHDSGEGSEEHKSSGSKKEKILK